MKPFVVSPEAADDMNDIWFYLAEHAGESFADQTLRRFVQAFRELADLPGLGHLRPDLTWLPVHFFLPSMPSSTALAISAPCLESARSSQTSHSLN